MKTIYEGQEYTGTADEIRSLLQNAKMWPMLGDIARQLDWAVQMDGRLVVRKLDATSWKHILTAGLEKQQTLAQGIDGGWVLLGQSTSEMSVKKFCMLLDLIKFFGDSKQVRWSAPKKLEQHYNEVMREAA